MNGLYKPCPLDSRIGVSEEGELINFKTGKILKQHLLKSGYLNIVITSPGEKAKAHKVHRLIAATYLPKIIGKDYVNHKDGNKLNNALSNLEWVTLKENIEHALDLGLWVTNNKIQIKNNLTNEVILLPSVGRAAANFDVNRVTLFKHLNSKECGKIDYNGYSFRYPTDEPWPEIRKRKRSALRVEVFDKQDNSLHIFDSMKSVSRHVGISYRVLYHELIELDLELVTTANNRWYIRMAK